MQFSIKAFEFFAIFCILFIIAFFALIAVCVSVLYVTKQVTRKLRGEKITVNCILGNHAPRQVSTKRNQCTSCGDIYAMDSYA